jgi:hypothetical protein
MSPPPPATLELLVLVASNTLPDTTVTDQAIASAIAASQCNAHPREDLGLEPLESMVIPCINMAGTRATYISCRSRLS